MTMAAKAIKDKRLPNSHWIAALSRSLIHFLPKKLCLRQDFVLRGLLCSCISDEIFMEIVLSVSLENFLFAVSEVWTNEVSKLQDTNTFSPRGNCGSLSILTVSTLTSQCKMQAWFQQHRFLKWSFTPPPPCQSYKTAQTCDFRDTFKYMDWKHYRKDGAEGHTATVQHAPLPPWDCTQLQLILGWSSPQ